MPQLSSSPPPLCYDNKGTGSEEEESGDFSAGADGSDGSSVEAASKLTSPTLNLDTSLSTTSTLHPVEQSQPTSTVNLKPTDDQARLEDSLHLKNGYPCSDGDQTSVLNACSVTNETDFADFSVFGEQAAHVWCCGLGGAEFGDCSEGVTPQKGLSEHFASDQEVILDCEPKSFTDTSKKEICTKVNHCENKGKSSQGIEGMQHFQMEGCYFEDKTQGKYGESHKERKHSFNLNFLLTSNEADQTERGERGKKEKSVSTLSQAARLYEGNASCDEDSSQGDPSEDFEPNVSSLVSQDDGTDTEDQTDDEEELRNYRLSRSFCNSDISYSLQTSDSEVGLFYHEQSAAQESSATSIQSECEPRTEDDQVFRFSFKPQKGQEHVQLAEGEVQSLGILPPSDSFADFCSASSQEEGEWALFQDQPDEQEGCGQLYDLTSGQVVLQHQVQQLFQDSFPEVISAEESEDPVHGLHALLFLKKQNGHEGEEEPAHGLDHQRLIPGMWWPSQDIHSATGLQYQWSGSHINKSLLRCLDVDTGNIVFIGIKKHPVVPACASHLVYHLV